MILLTLLLEPLVALQVCSEVTPPSKSHTRTQSQIFIHIKMFPVMLEPKKNEKSLVASCLP